MIEYTANINNFTKEQLGTIINVSNQELNRTKSLLDEAVYVIKCYESKDFGPTYLKGITDELFQKLEQK